MTRRMLQVLMGVGVAIVLLAASCEPQGVSLQVVIVSPAADAYTNGTLTVEVSVAGGVPDKVLLRLDGVELANLTSPYSYNWDTTGLAEATYELTAEATLGGRTFASSPRMVAVDRTPPTLTSRTPAPGATNVWLGETIAALFSEELDPSTVNDGSVIVTGQGSVALGKTLALSGTTLTVALATAPTLPNNLTVTFTNAVTDLAGNALAVPTDAWSWEVPDWLVLGGALSGEPGATDVTSSSLVAVARDELAVAWDEDDGTAKNIYVQRWDGTSWTSLGGPLSGEAGVTPAAKPVLAGNDQIGLDVAWAEAAGGDSGVYVRRWDGSSWISYGGPLLPEPGVSGSLGPSMVVPPDGMPVVARRGNTATTSNIYVARWNGSAWSALGGALSAEPDTVSSATRAGDHALAVDANGVLTLAWRETDGSAFNIYVRRWDGSVWTALGGALSAEPGATDAGFPALVVDGAGTATVAWEEYDGTATYVHVAQWDGAAWLPLGGALSADPSAVGAFNPALAVDAAGAITVAWDEWDGAASTIHVRRWDGSSWQSVGGPLRVNSPRRASLAVDAGGALNISWTDWDGTATNVYVRRHNTLP